jgi:hypothetical protein
MKLSQVPMDKLMGVLPKLSTNLAGDPVTYNLTTDVEPGRVPRPDYHMKFDDKGAASIGEGHVKGEGVITFILKQGGINTLIGMLLDGLSGGMRSASMAMMMGKVGIEPFSPANLKKTESFFKRVKTGEEALKDAAKAAGLTIDEIDI